MSDICRGKLTNAEYLKHMIPHHQVAVDISIMHQKKNKASCDATNIKGINLDSEERNKPYEKNVRRITSKY